MLDGAEGAGAALAMEILAGIGEVMEADVMVPRLARARLGERAGGGPVVRGEDARERGRGRAYARR